MYICIFLAALLLLHNLVIILCGTATKSHPFQLYIVIWLMNDVKILNSAQQKGKVILTVWVVAVNIPFLTFVQPVSVVNYANLPKTTVGSGFNDWVANASFVKPSSSADMKAWTWEEICFFPNYPPWAVDNTDTKKLLYATKYEKSFNSAKNQRTAGQNLLGTKIWLFFLCVHTQRNLS